jgi:hypothetical protein
MPGFLLFSRGILQVRCGLEWGRNLGDGIKNWDRSIEVHNIFPLYEFFCRPYDIVEYLKKEC